MSLFGDDYEPQGIAARSLFGDQSNNSSSSPAARNSLSSTNSDAAMLFGADDSGDPWSRPSAAAGARNAVAPQKPTISTLLDPSQCPPIYRDSFQAENPVAGLLTVENVRRAVNRAGFANSPLGDRITELIIRSKPDNRIDRGTWCVAMALIGLAQEGEDDLSLDTVDSRRYSLPVSKNSVAAPAPAPVAPAPVVAPLPASIPPPARYSNRAPSIRSVRTNAVPVPSPLSIPPSKPAPIQPSNMTPPSPASPPPPSIPVSDPWAADDDDDQGSYKPSNRYPSTSYSANRYTTSEYSEYNEYGNPTPASAYTSQTNGSTSAYASDYSAPTATSSVPGTYVADNMNSNYSSVLGADYNELARPTRNINEDLFTDEPIPVPQQDDTQVVEDDDSDVDEENEGNTADAVYVSSLPYERAQPYYDVHESDRIRVSIIPEKEGILVFKHVNYLLEGGSSSTGDGSTTSGGYRVVRRYSDFVWLLNCLLKRFPFRILPLLPPKRFAVNGHYLSSDEFFLERRRRGLSRFINELVKHPVLSREQLVVVFLSVPTELQVWRKQASVSVEDEFTGRSLPVGLVESWSNEEAERWEDVKEGVKTEAELYTHLCLLIDRMEKRQESVAADHARFANSLNTLQDVAKQTYSVDDSDLNLINDGVSNVVKYLNNAQTLLEDESRGWEIGVLEDFKRHRDTLISIKELFDRREKLDVNTIPYLERRIRSNETRLSGMRNRSDFKSSDIERVEQAIRRDKDGIREQNTRSWLIKECMRDELAYFQQTKYAVAKLFQDYAQERLKYAELFAENWRTLGNEISEVPTQAS
ncbi:uncharacterized protein V1516DRAFT_618068 [Lipomyces oligophaga]|uniref:uncharacterized protein n=1 Tax=Lipomyces oligophaga TaxID=45792 RepID=UPI0034CE8234